MEIKEIEQKIDNIVKALEQDIIRRKGLGDEWENIDDETAAKILNQWKDILREKIGELLRKSN